MRKPPRRETCTYEDCTNIAYHNHPEHKDERLCEKHKKIVFKKILVKSPEYIFLNKLIQNRELSFSEKINELDLLNL